MYLVCLDSCYARHLHATVRHSPRANWNCKCVWKRVYGPTEYSRQSEASLHPRALRHRTAYIFTKKWTRVAGTNTAQESTQSSTAPLPTPLWLLLQRLFETRGERRSEHLHAAAIRDLIETSERPQYSVLISNPLSRSSHPSSSLQASMTP